MLYWVQACLWTSLSDFECATTDSPWIAIHSPAYGLESILMK